MLPMLVARGERDSLVVQRWEEESAALISNSRDVVVPAPRTRYNSPAVVARIVTGLVKRSADDPPAVGARTEGIRWWDRGITAQD